MRNSVYVVASGALLFILGIADYALTMWVLSLGGYEANPVIAPIIDTPFAPILKIGIVGFVFYVAVRRYISSGYAVMLFVATALYVGIVSWNLSQLYRYHA